jgi:hypothetical protein
MRRFLRSAEGAQTYRLSDRHYLLMSLSPWGTGSTATAARVKRCRLHQFEEKGEVSKRRGKDGRLSVPHRLYLTAPSFFSTSRTKHRKRWGRKQEFSSPAPRSPSSFLEDSRPRVLQLARPGLDGRYILLIDRFLAVSARTASFSRSKRRSRFFLSVSRTSLVSSALLAKSTHLRQPK